MAVLSEKAVLIYILAESGVRGRLTSGRVERTGAGTLDVYDTWGNRIDYLSGNKLRSWCVVGAGGKPIDGWREILPEDVPKIIPSTM